MFSKRALGKCFELPVQEKLPSLSVIMNIQPPAPRLGSVVLLFNPAKPQLQLFVSTGGLEVDVGLITEPDHEKSWTLIPKARSSTNTGLAQGRCSSEQNTDGL